MWRWVVRIYIYQLHLIVVVFTKVINTGIKSSRYNSYWELISVSGFLHPL